MLYGWKQNSMLTNCLAKCAHLTITVSEIERDIGRKSSFFHTLFHSTPPLGGFPLEYRHPVWHGKTRMAWLPMVKKILKISLFVLAQLTNVTDRQTNGQTDKHRMPAIAALMHRQKKRLSGDNKVVIVIRDTNTYHEFTHVSTASVGN